MCWIHTHWYNQVLCFCWKAVKSSFPKALSSCRQYCEHIYSVSDPKQRDLFKPPSAFSLNTRLGVEQGVVCSVLRGKSHPSSQPCQTHTRLGAPCCISSSALHYLSQKKGNVCSLHSLTQFPIQLWLQSNNTLTYVSMYVLKLGQTENETSPWNRDTAAKVGDKWGKPTEC